MDVTPKAFFLPFARQETSFIGSPGLKMSESQAGRSMGTWITNERRAITGQKHLVCTETK